MKKEKYNFLKKLGLGLISSILLLVFLVLPGESFGQGKKAKAKKMVDKQTQTDMPSSVRESLGQTPLTPERECDCVHNGGRGLGKEIHKAVQDGQVVGSGTGSGT